jgi:hypothetical protein
LEQPAALVTQESERVLELAQDEEPERELVQEPVLEQRPGVVLELVLEPALEPGQCEELAQELGLGVELAQGMGLGQEPVLELGLGVVLEPVRELGLEQGRELGTDVGLELEQPAALVQQESEQVPELVQARSQNGSWNRVLIQLVVTNGGLSRQDGSGYQRKERHGKEERERERVQRLSEWATHSKFTLDQRKEKK